MLYEIVSELLNKSYVVFAVKGYGRGRTFNEALQDAKKPINIPAGFKYWRYRDLDITRTTLRLCGANSVSAVAVPGINNDLYLLDLEADLVKMIGDGIYSLFPPHDVYLEMTPRGGMHIILNADIEPPSYQGVKGFIDVKYKGYVIIAPSILKLSYGSKVKLLRYVNVSPIKLWETAKLSRYIHSIDRLFSYINSPTYIIEPSEGIIEVYTVPNEISKIISSLSVDQLLMVIYIISRSAGCGDCIEYYVVKLINNEPLEIANTIYPTSVQRGLHTVFEIEFFGLLKVLGSSDEQLYEVVERFRYKDYEPETPPVRNLRYNTFRNVYTIAFNGLCPIMLANKLSNRYVPPCGCVSSLVRKVSSHIKYNLNIIREAVGVVMEDEATIN